MSVCIFCRQRTAKHCHICVGVTLKHDRQKIAKQIFEELENKLIDLGEDSNIQSGIYTEDFEEIKSKFLQEKSK